MFYPPKRHAILTTSTLSIAALIRWLPSNEDACFSIVLVAAVSAVITALSTASSIHNGSSSLLFIDGSDHAGYGHVADWLLSHRVQQWPRLSPETPYESWPHYMYTLDPRLSALAINTLAAWSRGSSGLFAYDPTCAVVLTTAVLGVASVFSRSPPSLVLLSVGLLACSWFDLGRSGYLQPWSWILPRLFDLQNPGVDVIPASSFWLAAAVTVAILLQLTIIITA